LLSPDMPIPLPSPQHVAATAQDTSPHARSSEQSSTTTPVPVTPSVATPTPRDGNTGPQDVADDPTDTFSDGIDFVRIPSRLVHPYDPSQSGVPVGEVGNSPPPQKRRTAAAPNESAPTWTPSQGPDANQPDHAECHEDLIQDELHDELVEEEHPSDDAGTDYAGDMMSEVRRFASFATRAASSRQFDIIHAHDWMTYPAGLAVARRSGRPLVVHVHSTEFDRSGEHVNQQIYDIERRGMHGAMRVMTVSRLTRDIVIRRYGVDPRKVTVVYNGVAIDPHEQGIKPIGRREKIILYFGRITRQKGPESSFAPRHGYSKSKTTFALSWRGRAICIKSASIWPRRLASDSISCSRAFSEVPTSTRSLPWPTSSSCHPSPNPLASRLLKR